MRRMSSRVSLAAVLAVSFVVSCGEKGSGTPAPPATPSPGPAPGPTPAPAVPVAPSVSSVKVTPLWTWGETPRGEVGPRARDPNEKLPTGPTYIAAGKGKVAVATQDACLELLDAATGKAVVPRVCEKDGWTAGLGVIGEVAVIARPKSIAGYSLTNLKELWRRDVGFIQTNEPLARPGIVDGRFCALVAPPGKMAVTCLDGATGKVAASWEIASMSRVAFGDVRIGVIPADQVPDKSRPDLPVRFYTNAGKLVHDGHMSGAYGPTFEESRPIFRLQGGGNQSQWSARFVDATGADVLDVQRRAMLRGGTIVGDTVLTTEFGTAGSKDDVVALHAPDGTATWQTDLGVSGPWNPWFGTIGTTVFLAHFSAVFALDASTGKILERYDLTTANRAIWKSRLVFLVNARESRSDSDWGDAALYVIDATTRKLVFEDKLGTDVAGGQRASDPVFDDDVAVAIIGGRVHAYRVAVAP
jgi:outer membrane protein assembly factor BamB